MHSFTETVPGKPLSRAKTQKEQPDIRTLLYRKFLGSLTHDKNPGSATDTAVPAFYHVMCVRTGTTTTTATTATVSTMKTLPTTTARPILSMFVVLIVAIFEIQSR